MGIWKPSFPRSIIKVTDYRNGLPLRHIVSRLMNRIHIQKVSLSLIRGSTTLKERDLMKT